ncbi:MAG: MMPL family transporter [Magnetococcales bacterium]|nr:MMPL family transporter [Magnetococcales bacterium]
MKNAQSEQADTFNGGLARAYARWVMRLRWPILIAVSAITILAAFQIPNLDIRNDPDTLLPPSNRYVATNLYAEKTFGMGNLMVVGLSLEEGNIYQPWFINMVQEIHRKLEALPNSRPSNFISLAAQKVKYMGADENGLVFKRLIPTAGVSEEDGEKSQQQLAFLKEGLEENPVMAPMLLYMEDKAGNRCDYGQPECEAKATFIIADYDDEMKAHYLSWVRTLLEELEPYSHDDRFEVLVAGEPYFLAYMLLNLVDNWWLFAISFAIVIVILLKECRTVRGALFPLFGVVSTIIWTLGLMGFSDFKLTTMMVLTPMLLLAIGIGHAVQVTRRYMQEHQELGDSTEAGIRAIQFTIIPATLSIITDVAGFATLSLVDISFYKAYAYFGMFGMFTLILTTTSLIPAMMVMFPDKRPGALVHAAALSREQRMANGVTRLLTGPGKWLPVVGVAVVLALSVHYTKITEATAEDLMPGVEKGINYAHAAFKESSITIQDINRLGEIMPGVISLNIPIRGKNPIKPLCDYADLEPPACHDAEEDGEQGIYNDADVMADLARMEEWMRAHPYIGFTGSYAQYLKLVNMLLASEPGQKSNMAFFNIPDREFLTSIDPEDDRNSNDIIALYNGLLEAMTSEGDLDSFVDAESWNQGVLLGFVNTMDPVKTHQVVLDIQDYIEQHKEDAGFKKVNFGFRNADESGDINTLSKPGPDYVSPGIGGFLGATEATREVSMANWLSSPLQTGLAIFLIAALIFRSLLISGILVVILGITLFAQYGMAGYFTHVENWSGNLHFGNLVTLSIAMGLGVDYSIYMISRLREEMANTGQNWNESLKNTLATSGSAVLVSVIVLLGSFIPLMATELGNTWGLGFYIGEALVIDVVTALTLLPLLIYWTKPAYVFQKK